LTAAFARDGDLPSRGRLSFQNLWRLEDTELVDDELHIVILPRHPYHDVTDAAPRIEVAVSFTLPQTASGRTLTSR
jgi:hypothetical protein